MPKTIRLTKVEYSASSIAFPGQTESGDLHIVAELPDKVLIGVVDGMGHGHEAAVAAKSAIATVQSNTELSVIRLIKRCHEKLKTTRGAVMALASINYIEETLTWLSIGNVEAMLFRADPDAKPSYESIFMCPGVLGYRLSQLNATIIPISKGDILIFSTDGIRSDYIIRIASDAHSTSREISHMNNDLIIESQGQSEDWDDPGTQIFDHELSKFKRGILTKSPYTITNYIAKRFAKGSDDALVVAVKYLGRE